MVFICNIGIKLELYNVGFSKPTKNNRCSSYLLTEIPVAEPQ